MFFLESAKSMFSSRMMMCAEILRTTGTVTIEIDSRNHKSKDLKKSPQSLQPNPETSKSVEKSLNKVSKF